MQLKNRQYFRRLWIRGFFLTMMALSCSAFPAMPGWTQEIGHDYNYGLGKINLRSQVTGAEPAVHIAAAHPRRYQAWLRYDRIRFD